MKANYLIDANLSFANKQHSRSRLPNKEPLNISRKHFRLSTYDQCHEQSALKADNF